MTTQIIPYKKSGIDHPDYINDTREANFQLLMFQILYYNQLWLTDIASEKADNNTSSKIDEIHSLLFQKPNIPTVPKVKKLTKKQIEEKAIEDAIAKMTADILRA